ncbi:MAG: hypothetical protein K2L34_04985, partial [Muribaculaceae bacterium]|nr:hypothetical protein [Muribaculaceae bacterium]
KILFEEYMKKINQGDTVRQSLMFPEYISLDPEHQAALVEIEAELTRLGFTLEYEEDDRWRITTVPAMLRGTDAKDVVLRILDSISDGSVNYGNENNAMDDLASRMAMVMARSAAIQAGQKLSADEMEHLIGELFALSEPNYTPNGNLVFCLLDSSRLDSMFR